MIGACCALRIVLRTMREGRADERALFTCDKCGRAYRKHWGQWTEVSVADEITDMNAHRDEILRER